MKQRRQMPLGQAQGMHDDASQVSSESFAAQARSGVLTPGAEARDRMVIEALHRPGFGPGPGPSPGTS